VVHWTTKAAISLKRVKIEESYYGWPIEAHQRSFGRYHQNKSHKILGKVAVGVVRSPKILQGTDKGALRGHLCDSNSFLVVHGMTYSSRIRFYVFFENPKNATFYIFLKWHLKNVKT